MDRGSEHQRNQLVPFTEGDICQEKTTRSKSICNHQVLHSIKAHHRVVARFYMFLTFCSEEREQHHPAAGGFSVSGTGVFKRSFGEPTGALERLILQQSTSNLTDLERICSISGFLNPDVQNLYRHPLDVSRQSPFPRVVWLNSE